MLQLNKVKSRSLVLQRGFTKQQYATVHRVLLRFFYCLMYLCS